MDDPFFTKVVTPQNNPTAWFLTCDHSDQLEMWGHQADPKQVPFNPGSSSLICD